MTPTAPKRRRFGLLRFRSPLLAESLLFSLPAGTKMFQFPALASVLDGCPSFTRTGSPIRAPADLFAFADPRGLSRLVAPFFASWSRGIRPAPFSRFLARRHDPFGHDTRGISRVLLVFSSSFSLSMISFFVENKGFEPLTPCLQGRCSKPTELIPLAPSTVVPGGVEPPTSTLSVWRSNQLS